LAVLVSEGWEQRVRDKLGVDEAYLPDSALQQPDVIHMAEAEVKAAVPNWDELPPEKLVFLEAAVICGAAILIITSMPARLPEEIRAPHSEVRNPVDGDRRKEALIEERLRFLGYVQDDGSSQYTPGFYLAGPRRGIQ